MVKQVTKFCEQSSLLLRTIDDQMSKEGWEACSNTVTVGGSNSVLCPECWFPNILFRFYEHNDHKQLLVFVSILLNDDVDGEYKLVEPVVTAGYFDYGAGKEVGKNWEYFYAKWYGYNMKHGNEETIFKSEKNWKEEWLKKFPKDDVESYPFESWKCFGLPLISITNARDVESKIVNPLLKILPK